MNQSVIRQLRTWLALSRVSLLPTVWSNCLAGWWLGGQGNYGKLPLLFLGVSALYTGGAFLNDAFDADFDRQRRTERPIPSGAMSRAAVWRWGLGWLVLGVLSLAAVGRHTVTLAAILLLCILIYDATHRVVTASPWLMGLCRFWVYVIAASTGAVGVNGEPVWCGVALACYVAGLGYLARHEGSRGRIPLWPLMMLVTPVALAMLMSPEEYRIPALWLSLLLVLWIALWARTLFQPAEANVPRMVAGLSAGIVFVDWLAVAPLCPRGFGIAYLGLWGATLLLQRFVPTL